MLGKFLGKFMRLGSVGTLLSGTFGAALLLSAANSSATVYYGNGNSGFGGAVGGGSLTITDNGAGTITFSFNTQGASLGGNALALYISNGNANGLSDTSTLKDNSDGGRTTVSGYNSAAHNPVIFFPTGFKAAFGFSFEDSSAGSYAGLFGLPGADPAATATNLHYITGAGQGSEPIVVSVNVSQLGITEGQSFDFVGSLLSQDAYRADEAIGSPLPSGNPGYTGTETFTSFDTFSTPEPASLGIVSLLGVIGLRRRTRTASAS